MKYIVTIPGLYVDGLKKLANEWTSEEIEDEDDWSPDDWDSYNEGCEHGRIWAAREFLHMAGISYKEDEE